jgi:glycosyltransferase involved in cell wall biosynthesis
MVHEGESGLLAPPGDAARLACAIDTLLSDESRRADMGRAARMIVERDYTYKLQAARYSSLYRSLLVTGPQA